MSALGRGTNNRSSTFGGNGRSILVCNWQVHDSILEWFLDARSGHGLARVQAYRLSKELGMSRVCFIAETFLTDSHYPVEHVDLAEVTA